LFAWMDEGFNVLSIHWVPLTLPNGEYKEPKADYARELKCTQASNL
jgi:hypothetical protein